MSFVKDSEIMALKLEVEFLKKDRDASVRGERARCCALARAYGFEALATRMRASSEGT